MKIELTSGDNDNYLRIIEVSNLSFDAQRNTFSMSYCFGDCWGLERSWPIAPTPTLVQFQGIEVAIQFERQKDADEFGKLLIDADNEVQEGYRTMRG